jgi:glycosyltransferase involved in cell wall biosynthesis
MSVSIILTAYNRANQLAKTLKSILMQDYHPIETIVVEDGDDGRTQYIAKQSGVRYIQKKRPDLPVFQNPAKVHNLGIRAAQNDIVILQGGEVTYLNPTDVSKLIAPILEDSSLITTPCVQNLRQDGYMEEWYVHPTEGRRAGWIVNFCLAMTRERLLHVQGFEEGFEGYGYEDDHLLFCLRENGGKTIFVPEVVVAHQWHDRSKYVFSQGFTGIDSPQYAYGNGLREQVAAGLRPAIANYGKEWGRG